MYTCIYCLATGQTGFSRQEHVIPQAFGRFSTRNPVLNYRVCARCNNKLGAELDEWLARDSIEGHLRQMHLSTDEYRSMGGKSRTEYTVFEGIYAGASAYMVPGADGKATPKPFKQVGFSRVADEERDWYRFEALPACTDDAQKKYRMTGENFVLVLGDDQQSTLEKLKDLGWPVKSNKLVAPLEQRLGIKSLYCMDERHMRSIAKIAYGFAAFCLGPRLPGAMFDEARTFVNEGGDLSLVELRKHLQLSDRDAEQVAFAHFLGIRICPGTQALVVEVSLLNHITYKVTVARKFLSTPDFDPHALAFNLQDRTITRFEYTTTGVGPWAEYGPNGLPRIVRA